ncbi:MAG: leucine-rich repeat protein [Oscillospiraceae bacterium]|nr:leucine-rich repeat protein [Oscillospiraceae bacterium]
MEKKEFKSNIKFGLIAFIATTLLLSGCQQSKLKEDSTVQPIVEQEIEEIPEDFDSVEDFEDNTSGQLSMDSEMNYEEAEEIIFNEQPLVRDNIVLDLTKNNTEQNKSLNIDSFNLEFLGENKVAIKQCNDNEIEEFDYDVIKTEDPKDKKDKDFEIVGVRASAFARCKSLKKFHSQYVTSIGPSAFSWCSSLESVRVARTITEIGSEAFNKCEKLAKFNFDVDPSGYTYVWLPVSLISNQSSGVGNGAFAGCKSIENLCFYFNKDMDDKDRYVKNLEKINAGAFKSCSGIVSLSYTVAENDVDDEMGLGDIIYKHFNFGNDIYAYTIRAIEIEEN